MRTELRILSAGLLLSSSAVVASAQATPSAEVGTFVGVTVLTASSGPSVTQIGIPGGGLRASPTLYATLFASRSVMVEPQLAFSSVSGGGQTLTSLGVALQLGYLFTPARTGSPYVAANGAFHSLSGGGPTASSEGVGVALGYRFTVKNDVAIRADARYRRWLSTYTPFNEIGMALGVGATF
jgi:hypothetical protein